MNALGTYTRQRWTVQCDDCGAVGFSYSADKETAVTDLNRRGWRETPIRTLNFVGIGAACPVCAPIHHRRYRLGANDATTPEAATP